MIGILQFRDSFIHPFYLVLNEPPRGQGFVCQVVQALVRLLQSLVGPLVQHRPHYSLGFPRHFPQDRCTFHNALDGLDNIALGFSEHLYLISQVSSRLHYSLGFPRHFPQDRCTFHNALDGLDNIALGFSEHLYLISQVSSRLQERFRNDRAPGEKIAGNLAIPLNKVLKHRDRLCAQISEGLSQFGFNGRGDIDQVIGGLTCSPFQLSNVMLSRLSPTALGIIKGGGHVFRCVGHSAYYAGKAGRCGLKVGDPSAQPGYGLFIPMTHGFESRSCRVPGKL